MERQKQIVIILLLFAVALFGYQIQKNGQFFVGEIVQSSIIINHEVKSQSNNPIFYDEISINQINTSAQPKVWFFVNLTVVLLTPIVFIMQGIIDKKYPKQKVPELKPTEANPPEPTKEETRVESAAQKKSNSLDFIRYGFLVLFIQNIIILVLLIAVLATIPQAIGGNETPFKTMMRIYTITFNIDFLLAIMASIGLILISKEATYKIQSFVAMAFWIIWIPIGLVPRIKMIDSFGIFESTTILDFAEFAANFYGRDLFLINFGSISLAIALFYTANVLFKDQHIKGKGMVISFAIANYIIMSGFSLILLIMLTYGTQLTLEAIGSLMIVWGIFFFAKFIVSPVIGIIAGIQAFKQIK